MIWFDDGHHCWWMLVAMMGISCKDNHICNNIFLVSQFTFCFFQTSIVTFSCYKLCTNPRVKRQTCEQYMDGMCNQPSVVTLPYIHQCRQHQKLLVNPLQESDPPRRPHITRTQITIKVSSPIYYHSGSNVVRLDLSYPLILYLKS